MNRAKIILLCVLAAITYGVLHDQITARLCLEYFTVAHPPLFPDTSPTVVALCWGIAATIGIGTVLGILLSLVAHSGSEPPIPASQLRAPVARLLGLMALAAFIAGVSGFFIARHGVVSIPADLAIAIPRARHHLFIAVWFAHGASYLVGLAGGAFLIFRVWRARGRVVVISLVPQSPLAAIRTTLIAGLAAYILWLCFGAN